MPEQAQKELKIDFVEIERLLLDDENPRLSGISDKRSQDELVRVLWDEMAVSEVALSIAENGYFEEEPLFVVPRPPKEQDASKQRYTVVEGNRRLAAVKLLRDPELRRAIKATDLPEVSAKARAALDRLPVSVYPDKRSLWEFFGFRHVNGPKEWDSFSKAAYVAQVRRKYGIPLDVISRKIGDQHDTVVRIYRGYVLLEQAEQMTDFKREDRIANRFFFSHLYTAADQSEFQKFLGIDSKGSLKDKPVPKSHLPQLCELMVWLFGSKKEGKSPVVQKQFPDLNRLRRVLGDRQGLLALRSGISLERAHEISLGDEQRFQGALVEAKYALQKARTTVTGGYAASRSLIDQMESIDMLSRSVLDEMRAIDDRKTRIQRPAVTWHTA